MGLTHTRSHPISIVFIVILRRIFIEGKIKYYYYYYYYFFFLLALQPPLGVVFYRPLVGFSLLAYEVS